MEHISKYLIIVVSVLLACVTIGSFFRWWNQYTGATTLEFKSFVWSLVVSVVFLLITRAVREGRNL